MNEEEIECSDEETYFPKGQTFRCQPNGERIWEPSGPEIAKLYQEIEAHGYNALDWRCPGRISPSLLQSQNDQALGSKTEDQSADNSSQKTAFEDFDFDDSLAGGHTKLNAKRSQHGQKKIVTTNLSKVMANMRRYKDNKGQAIAIKSKKPPPS